MELCIGFLILSSGGQKYYLVAVRPTSWVHKAALVPCFVGTILNFERI